MNIDYEMTGKSYPVSVDELLEHCKGKFMEYDQLVKGTGAQPQKSPYTDPIVYTTQEGKLVQVPLDIQKQAVTEYKRDSQNISTSNSYEPPGFDPNDSYANSRPLTTGDVNDVNRGNLIQELPQELPQDQPQKYPQHPQHQIPQHQIPQHPQRRRQYDIPSERVVVVKEQSDNTKMWILLGLAALIIFMFFKSKN